MTTQDPKSVYNQRIEAIDLRLEGLKKVELALSFLKLLFVICGVYFLFRVALHYNNFVLMAFLFFLALFVATALVHESYIRKRNLLRTQRAINTEEIQAHQGEFLNYGTGEEFVNSDHEYSSDLGIFGHRSLFHFLNRTTTSLGLKVLSGWLRDFPGSDNLEEIRSRQDAVREVSSKIDFRQNIQAHGRDIDDSLEKLQSVEDFFQESNAVLGKKVFVVFIHVFPLVTLASIVLIFFNFSWLIFVGLVLIQGIVNWVHKKKVLRLYSLTARNSKILNVYSKIIHEIERESFENLKLEELKSHLFVKNRPASVHINKLATRFQYFEARLSYMIHFLMNNLFFWDLNCVYRIEKWKEDLKEEIKIWFEAIGFFDALSSLANLNFNFPEWTIPSFDHKEFRIEALNSVPSGADQLGLPADFENIRRSVGHTGHASLRRPHPFPRLYIQSNYEGLVPWDAPTQFFLVGIIRPSSRCGHTVASVERHDEQILVDDGRRTQAVTAVMFHLAICPGKGPVKVECRHTAAAEHGVHPFAVGYRSRGRV